MKSKEEAMEIVEAFDLTKSFESAGQLTGADPKTVRRYIDQRDVGRLVDHALRRDRIIDSQMAKIEEWVEHSKAKIRADVVHDNLVAMQYAGSERTTLRAVAEAKAAYRMGNRRVYRPWIPEPGMWFQFDWADGPEVKGRMTKLFCAWLAWSRFRVVIPTWDRTMPTLIACIDETLRAFGSAPTYALTDNEKTVTTDRIANIAVRHPMIVEAGRHYSLQIKTCSVADPESKGGVEATVKIAKADLVPTDANLLREYQQFDELKDSCRTFMDTVNSRPHTETKRVPNEMLIEERARMHPIPSEPFTAAFGETRKVAEDSTIRFNSSRYSVPHALIGQAVWASVVGEELVVVHVGKLGSGEVARHRLTTPGNPQIDPAHYPERTTDPLNPKPKPKNDFEKQFLSIGEGATQWLIEAAATGAERVRVKMTRAIELASLVGADVVDRALGRAAAAGRFDEGDLESIIEHVRREDETRLIVANVIADEGVVLQHGTSAWNGLGR